MDHEVKAVLLGQEQLPAPLYQLVAAHESGQWAQSTALAKQLKLMMKRSASPGGRPCSGLRKRQTASEKQKSEVRGQIAEVKSQSVFLQSDLPAIALWRLDQFHFPISRPVQHHQLADRIAEYENIFVAEMRLFDRFFQRHWTQRNRVPGMDQMHFRGPRHRRKFMNQNRNSGAFRQSDRRLKFSCSDWPSNFLTAFRFLLSHFVLYLSACFCR